jgi:lysyl endopeptidase
MVQHGSILRMISAIAALTLLVSAPAGAAGPDDLRSMPQGVVENNKRVAAERFTSNNEIAHRVVAAPWRAADLEATKASSNATGSRAKRLQIGYPREISQEQRNLPLAALPWQALADGSRVARLELSAADAPAFRLAYRLNGPVDGLQVRFAGNARDEVYLSQSLPNAEVTWSPVLEGDVATIELRLMPEFQAAQFDLSFEQLSHLVVSPSDFSQKSINGIGKSGACNIDVACELQRSPSQPLLNLSRAVAKMVFSSDGKSFLCTGTLLNSSSGANYFYSAAHCISTQAEAVSLSTYWFFDAVACNSIAIPGYQLVNGGADLRFTDLTMDVTLLQLRDSPPTGAIRAGWNATVIPTGSVITGMHHPSGDLKKFSQGSMLGYVQGTPLSEGDLELTSDGKANYIQVRWARGTTEGGSSGSGVFTFNPAGFYELRGGLSAGSAQCSNPNGTDEFARMDLLYTRLAPFLNPSAVIPSTTTTQASMVEFFNPQFNFYFISSREGDKSALDNFKDTRGNKLWYRTGYWFKADPNASSFTSPLTRYYIPGAAKMGARGSHFYTVLNADRTAITNSGRERISHPTFGCDGVPNGYFCNEGRDSYIAPPLVSASGTVTCLDSEQKIYRVFRANSARYTDDGNHRYLTSASMYSYMVTDLGWVGEGIAFCATP